MCIYITTKGGRTFRIFKKLFYPHPIYDMVIEISAAKVFYIPGIFILIKAISWVKYLCNTMLFFMAYLTWSLHMKNGMI
jgi:cytochrome c oxidase assembly factor CtaG